MKKFFGMMLCLVGCVEQNTIPTDYHPTRVSTHPTPGYVAPVPPSEEQIIVKNMQSMQRAQCSQSCMMMYNQCLMARNVCIAFDSWAQANCNIQNIGHTIGCNRQRTACYATCP
jgi:hypothetical protein